MRSPSLVVLVAVALSAAAGCATAGRYVPVDGLPDEELRTPAEYIIEAGDLLGIRVYGQDGLSGQVRVRPDGRITLPFVNEQVAAGLTPEALAQFLQAALKTYVVSPVVGVSLEERHPRMVSVLGSVTTPGVFPVGLHDGVLAAVARAGGLTPLADRDRIFVVRTASNARGGAPLRVRFTYEALSHAGGAAARFELRDGDAVIVE